MPCVALTEAFLPYWPLIGGQWSRDLNTLLWLVDRLGRALSPLSCLVSHLDCKLTTWSQKLYSPTFIDWRKINKLIQNTCKFKTNKFIDHILKLKMLSLKVIYSILKSVVWNRVLLKMSPVRPQEKHILILMLGIQGILLNIKMNIIFGLLTTT